MAGCRDCARCTETPIKTLIWLIPRILWWFLTVWNIRLFQKRCPQCGHKMSMHQMVRGRFQD